MQNPKINMQNKRGTVIMPVIIAVLGIAIFLAIIIYFFGGIPWTSTIDKEACHNSIIQRATFNAGPIEAGKNNIPLNCKTEKVCITESGNDCTEYPKPTRKNPVTKVEVKGNEDAREAVLDQIADSMYECHRMLGEGKINFMPHGYTQKNYCLICTRLAFDTEVEQQVRKIPYSAIYQHLQQKHDPDGRNYLSYIHPGWENWQASINTFDAMKTMIPEMKDLTFEDWQMDLTHENGYAIIVQIKPQGSWVAAAGAAGVVGGVLIAGTAIAAAIPAGGLSLVALPAFVGLATGGTLLGGITYWELYPGEEEGKGWFYSPPTIYPYDIPTLSSLDCTSFETAP